MTFRRALEADVPAIIACLSARPELAMFPLSNLAEYGLDGEGTHACAMWVSGDPVTDVLAHSNFGMVMPFLRGGGVSGAAAVLSGREVSGFAGRADWVRALQDAMGLSGRPAGMDEDEGQYLLDLSDLVIPEGAGEVVPAGPEHRDLLIAWMTDYHLHTLHTPPEKAADMAVAGVDRHLANGARVMLEVEGVPVATTAFNARLPQIVQIGGVYTPPEARGKGLARRAVALHLAGERAKGVRQATLFSSNPSAIAAYEAVGFQRIGDWSLILFDSPQVAP